jgi:hypothetical protein
MLVRMWKTIWRLFIFIKLKIEWPYDPTFLLLGIYTKHKEYKSGYNKGT